jgi:hypothetical protein
VRVSQDAEAALTIALTALPQADHGSMRELIEAATRHSNGRLFLLLDQFEEFIRVALAPLRPSRGIAQNPQLFSVEKLTLNAYGSSNR